MSELADKVRSRIDSHPGDDFLYYGARAIVVGHCLGWDLGAAGPKAKFRFRRLVTGNGWNSPEWEFFVAWQEIVGYELSSGRLRGGNLTDCVFLDPTFLAAAEAIEPDSDVAAIQAFKDKAFGFDGQP